MRVNTWAFVVAISLVAVPGQASQGTAPADYTGHWQGAIETPRGPLVFELDIVAAAGGTLGGTIDLPGEEIKGLPLVKAQRDGASLIFAARSDQVLTGTLSDDGRTMSGTFTVSEGSVPFSATRTGDARAEPRPALAPVAKALEGRWTGTLEAGGILHLVLTIANEADGTASATVVNVDQGGLTIPVTALKQVESQITMDFKAISATYTGTLNADGTTLAGTFTQHGKSAPLTFTRED